MNVRYLLPAAVLAAAFASSCTLLQQLLGNGSGTVTVSGTIKQFDTPLDYAYADNDYEISDGSHKLYIGVLEGASVGGDYPSGVTLKDFVNYVTVSCSYSSSTGDFTCPDHGDYSLSYTPLTGHSYILFAYVAVSDYSNEGALQGGYTEVPSSVSYYWEEQNSDTRYGDTALSGSDQSIDVYIYGNDYYWFN